MVENGPDHEADVQPRWRTRSRRDVRSQPRFGTVEGAWWRAGTEESPWKRPGAVGEPRPRSSEEDS